MNDLEIPKFLRRTPEGSQMTAQAAQTIKAQEINDDPFNNPEILALQEQISGFDDKIKDLQKEKAEVSRKLRSTLSKLITKKLSAKKSAE